MRAIGIRGARVSVDVSLPAAKVTSDEFRDRSIPLKQSPGAGDATNKARCRPLFALKQSACLAVEQEMPVPANPIRPSPRNPHVGAPPWSLGT
jgi:hypothetical protein